MKKILHYLRDIVILESETEFFYRNMEKSINFNGINTAVMSAIEKHGFTPLDKIVFKTHLSTPVIEKALEELYRIGAVYYDPFNKIVSYPKGNISLPDFATFSSQIS